MDGHLWWCLLDCLLGILNSVISCWSFKSSRHFEIQINSIFIFLILNWCVSPSFNVQRWNDSVLVSSTEYYVQGRHSNQCHRAMALVDLLPRPESQYIYWAPRKKDPIKSQSNVKILRGMSQWKMNFKGPPYLIWYIWSNFVYSRKERAYIGQMKNRRKT